MDQQLVWARGFGFADLENQIEATVDTPRYIASVPKTFAAVVLQVWAPSRMRKW